MITRIGRTTRGWVAFSALFLAACSGGGSSSGGAAEATFEVLVSDAPADDLSTFEVTLTGVFLRGAAGQESANLLSTSRSTDLRSLSTRSSLLEVTRAGLGPWTDVRVELSAASVLARDLTGTVVPVVVVSETALAPLSIPLGPIAGGLEILDIEIDLDASLDDSSGSLRFDPILRPRRRTGEDRGLDEVHGSVLSVDASTRSLQLSLRDRETNTDRGVLTLSLTTDAVLFDDDGGSFADDSSFFQAASGSFLEAHGSLRGDGVFQAHRVKVEDGSGSARIHVKGVITSLDSVGGKLDLRITRIDKGRDEVLATLESLGNPSEITLDFGNTMIVIEGSNPRRGSAADLAVGLEIKAKFQNFSSPFQPARIEIEHSPQFEGTIVQTLGLPDEIVVHLERHDPAVVSGRVDSSRTDVSVALAGVQKLYLHLSHEPSLERRELFPGSRVKVFGRIDGPSSGPTITADQIRVRPGRLRGVVDSIERVSGSFVVRVDRVDDEFGGGPLGDPVAFVLAADARFDGDASSASRFFELFEDRGSEVLEVEVFGIARAAGGAIAHEVDARLR